MKFKNLILSLALLGALLFSCEETTPEVTPVVTEETETSSESDDKESSIVMENNDCPSVDFEFSAIETGDNEVFVNVAAPLSDELTYSLNVVRNNDEIFSDIETIAANENVFSFQVEIGFYEICLVSTSESCPEGATNCKTLSVDFVSLGDATSSAAESTSVVLNSDGKYILETEFVEGAADCDLTEINFNSVFGGQTISVGPRINSSRLTYQIDITKTADGVATTETDISGDEDSIKLNINDFVVGTNEFCLITSSSRCPDGIASCKTIVISGTQFDDANTDVDSIKRIDVVPAEDDNLTIEVIRK